MVQLRWTIIFPNWEIDSRLLRNNTSLLIFLFFFHFLISQVNKFNDVWKKKNISTFLITRLMIVIMKILRHATHSYWLSWTGLNSHTKIFVICCSCRLRAHWNTRPCTTCGRKNTLKRTKISKRVRSSHLASNYKFSLTRHLSSIFGHGSSFVQGFKLVW